ncbi:MAG: cupin domain-containing protein [Pseudomonadota bacterium]
MTVDALIRAHQMQPHPFEGWWRQTARDVGEKREGLQLFSAMDEAGWHRMPAAMVYSLKDGGPVAISTSHDRRTAHADRLIRQGDSLPVAPGTLRALSCLGSFALLSVVLTPDCALTDRILMPDDWFPQG